MFFCFKWKLQHFRFSAFLKFSYIKSWNLRHCREPKNEKLSQKDKERGTSSSLCVYLHLCCESKWWQLKSVHVAFDYLRGECSRRGRFWIGKSTTTSLMNVWSESKQRCCHVCSNSLYNFWSNDLGRHCQRRLFLTTNR